KAHERADRPALMVVCRRLGLVGGLLLGVLTNLVARYGPSSNGWSLRGNARFVPLGIGPAMVCGALKTLVLHSALRSPLVAAGVGAGLVGAGLNARAPVFPTPRNPRVSRGPRVGGTGRIRTTAGYPARQGWVANNPTRPGSGLSWIMESNAGHDPARPAGQGGSRADGG